MNKNNNDTKRIKVLVVEDNHDMARVITGILQAKGCETTIARNCDEALKSIATNLPDVISCDIQLGGKLTGLDLARAIKSDSRTAHLFLIAISGFSGYTERNEALTAGFDMFFSKPVKFADLTKAIQTVSAKRVD